MITAICWCCDRRSTKHRAYFNYLCECGALCWNQETYDD